jgi:hypothetical protein
MPASNGDAYIAKEVSGNFIGQSARYQSVVAQVKEKKVHTNVACSMSFGTQRGLSIHERHAHPAIINEKRRGADPQIAKRWTVEEVILLKDLEEIYKDYRYPNIEINKICHCKEIEQIKNKRRKLKLVSEDASLPDVA